MTALIVRPRNLPTRGPKRWFADLAGWFFKRAYVAEPHLGSDFERPHPVGPGYDLQAAMSAIAAFPWVYAAMMRRSADLAGLPLQVYRGRGRRATMVDDHALYDLLDRPNTSETGRQFRRQMVIDYRLTGNHFTAIFGERELMSLMRLHPHRMEIKPGPTGILQYVYNGGTRPTEYDPDQILHTRLPSWEDDPRGLFGTGAIRALHNDLTTDLRTAKRTSEMAGRGRPDVIVSPKDDMTLPWGDDFRAELKTRMNEMLQDGGTAVIGSAAKVEFPTWTPRDMEYEKVRQLTREAILAVTGVPPHLIGLPTANYALAERQEAAYWQMQLADAADVEDALLNPLARRWERGLSVRHDFSGVDVLQKGRTERLNRVVIMVEKLNATPAQAAAYEGLHDMPVPDEQIGAATSAPAIAEPAVEPPAEPEDRSVIQLPTPTTPPPTPERGLFGLPRSQP